MDCKLLITVFTAVFLAELGDKTQLATLLFAANRDTSKLTVFIGAALALIVTSALGVLAGGLLSQYLNPKYLQLLAGGGFLAIGLWMLLSG